MKERFYKIHKIKPITTYEPNDVVFIVTNKPQPTFLGMFLGKDIQSYQDNKITFTNNRSLINVELCGKRWFWIS